MIKRLIKRWLGIDVIEQDLGYNDTPDGMYHVFHKNSNILHLYIITGKLAEYLGLAIDTEVYINDTLKSAEVRKIGETK